MDPQLRSDEQQKNEGRPGSKWPDGPAALVPTCSWSVPSLRTRWR